MRAGQRYRGRLAAALAITAGFLVLEVVVGVWTNSLSLLSDAGHMFTDVLGLAMALAAIQLASRFDREKGKSHSHTFGLYRLEILAAFVNALLLFALAVWVIVEAIGRLGDPPEVLDGQMLVVAIAGLGANIASFLLLRDGASESMNLEGAYLEVLADMVGSVGVILAALAMRWFGWNWADPVVAIAIGIWILPRTFALGRKAVRVLLQAAPEHIDVGQVGDGLAAIEGVVDVHDLHVWTLTSQMEAASAHLVAADGADHHAILDQARALLTADFGIEHGTFQVEPASHGGCDELDW